MIKNFKVLIFLAILMQGCATTSKYIDPLCVNPQPLLAAMSLEDQRAILAISPQLLLDIATNQLLLTDHIALVERLIAAHNEQFKAECW